MGAQPACVTSSTHDVPIATIFRGQHRDRLVALLKRPAVPAP
jgi:hypothetical protein